MIRVVDVEGERGLDIARRLFGSYAVEFADSIAETLCFQGFEAEVAGMPGRYAAPSGCLLLAMDGDTPAGCVALRDLGGGTCEMKRLYVAPEFRGRGVGRSLVEEVIRHGGRAGYQADSARHGTRDGRGHRPLSIIRVPGDRAVLGLPGRAYDLPGEAPRRLIEVGLDLT